MKERRAYRFNYQDVAEVVDKSPAAVRKQMARTVGRLDRDDPAGNLKRVVLYVQSCGGADVG